MGAANILNNKTSGVYAAVLSSNQTYTSDDTLNDVTDLTLTVPVGTYILEFCGIIDNGAGFFKCDIGGGTATDSLARLLYISVSSTGAAATPLAQNTTNLADDAAFGVVEEFKGITATGSVTLSAGGTVIFRASQYSSNADPSILYAGAFLRMTRVG